MSKKKCGALAKIVIVLVVCAFTLFTISPSIAVAVEGAAAAAGVAGAGAVGDLGPFVWIVGGLAGIGLIWVIVDALKTETPYYPPAHGAHGGH